MGINVNILIGSSIALLSNCLSSLGINLQSSANLQNTLAPTFFTKLKWYFGFGLYISAQMGGSLVALIFISPMILAPIGSSGLIFNIIFARLLLKQQITKYDVIGTLMIMVGCALILIFCAQIPQIHNTAISDLMARFSKLTFVVYISVICCISLLLLLIIVTKKASLVSETIDIEKVDKDLNAPVSSRAVDTPSSHTSAITMDPVMVDIELEIPDSYSDIKPSNAIEHRSRWYSKSIPKGILLASLGGILGSITLLLTKSSVDIVLATISKPNGSSANIIFAVCVLAVLICTTVSQEICISVGLKYDSPVIILPVFYSLYTVLSLSTTLVYTNSFEFLSVIGLVCLILGLAVLLAGVFTLSRKPAVTNENDK